MQALGYVDFVQKYKHDNDCEPSSHEVWNACSLFMEEKLTGTQQLKSAISLVKCVACRKFNPDQQFELFNILDRLEKQANV